MLIDKIENNLKEMDQASFQELVNELLNLEGYNFYSSPGTVVGNSKTTIGCPDTIFISDEDKLVLCEITTQQTNLFNKLQNDIQHCLGCNNVNKDNVSKIILVFNSKLKKGEEKGIYDNFKLNNLCIDLDLYNIQRIANLAIRYPVLNGNFHNLNIPSNITTLNNFLKNSEKGVQPSLCNKFFGREEDLKQSKKFLEKKSILVLSGKSGVGKSKLSIQIALKLKNEDYQIIVVKFLSKDLINSLNSYINKDSKYCIIFDDLNGDFTNFENIIQGLLNDKSHEIKIIITTRDYFLTSLRLELQNYLFKENVYNLDELSSDVIYLILEEIIFKKDFALTPQGIEWIVNFSKGNPRLAIMAIDSLSKKDSNLDISHIYKNYFDNINKDISVLENFNYLRALGILSFFESINKNDNTIKILLKENFEINFDELWEIYLNLSRLELVEIFDYEIVKISDQAFMNFLLYETFFEKKIISFKQWVTVFIKGYNNRIYDILVELSRSFGFNYLNEKIQDLYDIASKKSEVYNQENLTFFEIFYYFFENLTLIFLRKWKDSLKMDKTPFEDIKLSSNESNIHQTKELILLSQLFRLEQSSNKSIDLSLDIVLKNHTFLVEISDLLYEKFIFKRFDYTEDYYFQNNFINFIIRTDDYNIEKRFILDKIFLAKAPLFFNWEHFQSEYAGKLKMNLYTIQLNKTDSLMDIRQKILQHLFKLYENYRNEFFECFEIYINSIYNCKENNLSAYEEEKSLCIDFFKEKLDSKNFYDCLIVKKYVETFSKKNIQISNVDNFLKSEVMEIIKIYSADYNIDLSNEDIKNEKLNLIKNSIEGKLLKDIKNIFLQIDKLNKLEGNISPSTVCLLFQCLFEKNPNYLLSLTKFCIEKNLNINIQERGIKKLINCIIKNKLEDIEKFYEFLNCTNYDLKTEFLFNFFVILNKENLNFSMLINLINFFKNVNKSYQIKSLNEFYKFNKIFKKNITKFNKSLSHSNIITYITDIILNSLQEKSFEEYPIFDLFFIKNYGEYFNEDIDLLENIFCILIKQYSSFDISNDLKEIIKKDKKFLITFLEKIVLGERFYYKSSRINLSFIWELTDMEMCIDKSVDLLISKQSYLSPIEHPLCILFDCSNEFQKEKMLNYLHKTLKQHYNDENYVIAIMNVVLYCFNNEFLNFLKEFLSLNQNIKIMKKISLFKIETIGNDKISPLIDKKIFLNKIKDIINSFKSETYDYHIKYVDEQINSINYQIDLENKRKFEESFMV